mmetsp:Transcript_27256/g.70651  ORF Transcript_27256/g.70651 Transcript_27256/m.70651 type:complete len:415 (-) Transcript_27256:108-1352(-)
MRPGSKKTEYIIYFWQGHQSSTDEKAASAFLTAQLDQEYNDAPVQVRVVQGKEPAHFRTLFKGRMIVHHGGRHSGFRNSQEEDTYDTDGIALFHIKGTNEINTCALQVPEKADSLNSGDCFVLVTPDKVFCWRGTHANDAENQVASTVAESLAKTYLGKGDRSNVPVNEGEEPEDFWTALGGKGEYAKVAPGQLVAQAPRLFDCSDCTGDNQIFEVFHFDQGDLKDGDCYILDTFTEVFVWTGNQADAEIRKFAREVAERFISESTDGRDPHCPVVMTTAGREPPMFTQHFPAWDPEFHNSNAFKDPYQVRLAELQKEKAAREAKLAEKEKDKVVVKDEPAAPAAPVVQVGSGETFSLEVLQKTPAAELGIPPTQKEQFLSDADFQDAFKMGKAEFAALPAWKQKREKERLKIF